MATPEGQRFINECQRYGIHIEHQLHAASDLLPRHLFKQDSTMFRMDADGRRCNDVNLCVHSKAALDTAVARALHYARLLPSTNLYYLKENLEVFPVETAVVLEYWIDVSMFSGWKKPAVKCRHKLQKTA